MTCPRCGGTRCVTVTKPGHGPAWLVCPACKQRDALSPPKWTAERRRGVVEALLAKDMTLVATMGLSKRWLARYLVLALKELKDTKASLAALEALHGVSPGNSPAAGDAELDHSLDSELFPTGAACRHGVPLADPCGECDAAEAMRYENGHDLAGLSP